MSARTSVTLTLTLGLALAGCKKHEGSSCKAGESTCIDKVQALSCKGAKMATVKCDGPLGCTTYEGRANCDDSVANAGDACMNDGEEQVACTPDKTRALVCKGGVFERSLECRGKGGCVVTGRSTVTCDTSVADKGAPCRTQGSLACTSDGKQMVVCRNGAFDLHRQCRGARGCQVTDAPSCDETLALEQDPCGMPGQIVCSVDGKSELICQSGMFTRSRACKKGCTVTGKPGRPIECN